MRSRLLRVGFVACASVTVAQGANARPTVAFVDAVAGPTRGGEGGLGMPIAIFGHGFGAQRGRSRVTIGGREVARYVTWGHANAANRSLDMIVVQPGPKVRAGPITVDVAGTAPAVGPTFAATRGRVLWVAPAGADSSACVFARPCATIQHVLDTLVRPGDAILVRGGELNDDEVWIRAGKGGTTGQPITIRNQPGERPTFSKHERPMIVDASDVAVSGFDFPGGKSIGLGTETARRVRLVNSTFSGGLGFDAVGSHGDDVMVAGNVCEASGSSVGTQGHCFYISHGHRIQLLNNTANGAPGYGIHIFDQQRATDDIRREITDVLVQGNVLSGSTERSGLILAMGDEGHRGNHIARVTIRGNTFTGNNFAGITVGANVVDVRVEANTFVANGRQAITISDEPTINRITIVRNDIRQSANGTCQVNCSWYALASVQVGPRARGVRLTGNRYLPKPPILIGAREVPVKR